MIAFVVLTTIIIYNEDGVLGCFAIPSFITVSKIFIAYILCSNLIHNNEQYQKQYQTLMKLYYMILLYQYEGIMFYQSILIKNGKIIAFVV